MLGMGKRRRAADIYVAAASAVSDVPLAAADVAAGCFLPWLLHGHSQAEIPFQGCINLILKRNLLYPPSPGTRIDIRFFK
jgi:hypothetical protein